MIVTPLDEAGARARQRKRHWSEANLSTLQRWLLKAGLLGLYSRPLDLACGLPDPGHFKIRPRLADINDREERARRRASAGRALKRLIGRGLLERCCRGKWRLTAPGAALARKLYPQIKPSTRRELAHRIAFHKAAQSWQDAHPTLAGKRRRAPRSGRASSKKPARPGVRVQLDCSML